MIKKQELRKRVKELELKVLELHFQADSYKQVAEFYSSLSEKDDGKFARSVIQDVQEKLIKKNYKPVNYSLAQIFSTTNQTFPQYVESLFGDSDEDGEY